MEPLPFDHRRADDLLARLLDLPPAERPGLLDEGCGEDGALRAQVLGLLEAAEARDDFLDPDSSWIGALRQGLAAEAAEEPAEDETPLAAGRRLGPYRILEEIGRGGMAVVYRAERVDGELTRRVAVKVLKPGVDTEEVVRRFEQERQILADLDHPAIARLVDGGRAEEGRPYLVMELVDGVPIDRYCDHARLGVTGRLELVLEVARAVRYAHQRLVVHRDLKPSNMIVTPAGGVKLLDFGIAKLLDPAAAGAALTRTRLAFMTPEYASPEQVRGAPVTTASDVYQLGLLLYELLSGRRPYELGALSQAAVERTVCEHDPPPPSTVVCKAARRDGPAAGVASRRGTTPERLRKRLRGDLDAIVSTALAKDPARRYGSVAELIADLKRHLTGQPVEARRPTALYRAGKFLRRHRQGAAAAAAIALLLIGYAATVTYQAGQLAAERDQVRIEAARAERVRDTLVGLLEAADPYGERSGALSARALVEAGVEQIRDQLHDDPQTRAELLGVLGVLFVALDDLERAEEALGEALDLQRRLHPQDHPDLARALWRHAGMLSARTDWQAGERFAREALEMRRRLHGDRHPEVAESLGRWAFMLLYLARHGEAEEAFREALELGRRLGLAHDDLTAKLWNGLGITLTRLGRLPEAESAYGQALGIRRGLFAPDHAAIATIHHNLGVNLMHQGRFGEAEPLLRESLAIRRRAHGEGHPRVASTLDSLGRLLRVMGEPGEAAGLHREAQALRTAEGRRSAQGLHDLARLAQDSGAAEEAERLYSEALSIHRDRLPAGHWQLGDTATALGWLRLRQGRVAAAESLLEEALSLHLGATGEDSFYTAEARCALGLLRAAQGRTAEARALLAPGLERLGRYALADPTLVAEATRALAALPRE